MGNAIFGTPKKPEQASVTTSISSVQTQISVLESRKKHLERLIEMYDQKAKESKKQEDVHRYLKQKINYKNELKTVFGMLDKLEGLNNASNQILLQKTTIAVTDQATKVIKSNTIDSDKAEDIMFDAKEAMEDVEKVNEVFSRPEPISEDLQRELDELTAPEPVKQPEFIQFPDVPNRPVQATTQEDTNLKRLLELA